MRRRTTPILQVLLLLIALFVLVSPSTTLAQGTPLIDTRQTTTGQSFNSETVQNLPAGRDFSSLLSTAPGVQTEAPSRPSAGTSGDALITIDGITIGDLSALGGDGAYKNFDMIDEVQVQTGGASAEYGNAVSGVINVVTKDGTNTWEGTGRFLGDDPYGLKSRPDPRIMIEILQNMEDAGGGYCLNGVQVQAGGSAVPTGSDGPIDFGFDSPVTIGVGPGSGANYGAGASGNLNLVQIPGCAGQPYGLSFVDAPHPVTPPNPTHLAFLENGVYAVDMGRIGSQYGLADERGETGYQLEDTHIFNSNFYLTGMASYKAGGFQLGPQTGGQAAGAGQGFFVYGIDARPGASEQPAGLLPKWDFYSIRVGDAPARLPDANGDGHGDSYFLSLAQLSPGCQNAVGGAFKAGTGGAGGGSLEADPGAFEVDCGYLQERYGDWTIDAGLRYDDFEPDGQAQEYVSPFSGNAQEASRPRLDGAIPPEIRYAGEFAGFRIAERTWIYGEYDASYSDAVRSDEPLASLFSESFYHLAPNYTQLFPHGFYSTGAVQSAPTGRGVQDVGLEIDGQPYEEVEPAWLGHDRYAPGGAELGAADVVSGASALRSLATHLDSPLIYVVAQGGPTGEVFRVQVVQPESGPVEIHGLVAVEPVAATAADRARFERELADTPGTRYAQTAAGYCLQMDALAPPAGTVYRVAPAEKQAAFAPMRRALDAARRLRDAGALHPDSDPTDYYHSIRQWAVWTVEKGFDRAGFLDAFVERMEKNFREAGQPWSSDVAAAVRSYGEGRWTDIQAILDAAATP